MSDITLSPIPYNGGTLAMTNANSHICHLTGNKFFAIFGQTTPNYTFAATLNVNDLHAGLPTIAVGKQRVMGQSALTRARVWKLSASSVLALVNGDLVVYKVVAGDDIVQATATISAFHSQYLWGTEVANTYGLGSYLTGQYIKDNTVWFVQRPTSTGAIVLLKVVYDPTGDTLTKTTIITLVASTTASHFWRSSIQQIPGTTNWVVSALGGNTTLALSSIPGIYVYDENGVQQQAIVGTVPANFRALAPLASNKILALFDAKTFRSFNGTAWAVADAIFAPVSLAGTSLILAEAIDDDYFMTVSTTSGIECGVGTYSFRISRFIDETIGQTSPSTNTGNGISYANLNVYFDQRVLQGVDSTRETFVVLGRASANAFRIRILYQAA